MTKLQRVASFKHLLVCEDIRTEKSGKHILIGAYSGSVVVQSEPPYNLRLAFRIEIAFHRLGIFATKTRVFAPNGDMVAELEATLQINAIDSPVLITTPAAVLQFTQPGNVKLTIEIEGRKYSAGEFKIIQKLPSVPESEKQKIEAPPKQKGTTRTRVRRNLA